MGKIFQDLYIQVGIFPKACVRHNYIIANQNSSPEQIYKYRSLTPLTPSNNT